MKKGYDFSKLKEMENPLRGQEKGRGNPFEPGSGGLFQRTGGGGGTSLPEADSIFIYSTARRSGRS